jgi:hypothetical protein
MYLCDDDKKALFMQELKKVLTEKLIKNKSNLSVEEILILIRYGFLFEEEGQKHYCSIEESVWDKIPEPAYRG